MKLRILSSIIIFLGSYLPLAAILVLQDISKESWEKPICDITKLTFENCQLPTLNNPEIALAFLGITAFSFVFFILTINSIKSGEVAIIEEAKQIPGDIINYVFPYVVSFMGVDISDKGKLSGFVLFLAWLFLITHKSGQIFLNPLLILSNWKYYEVTYSIGNHKRTEYALSKNTLIPNSKVRTKKVQDINIMSQKD
ncbi:hypothetical protein [Pseudomonas sp.]|uniref:hypothetical protein n=1 Tax=Pseudomonas sp. TaxID=306 RepID=UPI002611FDB0|nr:hypothetical protein [Pseudomonas sp.]